jgi:hypothetical protein
MLTAMRLDSAPVSTLACRRFPRLEVGERLPVGVPDDIAASDLVGPPWRGEAARGFCHRGPPQKRAVTWKQWKRGTTRFAELRRRGVGRDLAARTAGSPVGPWRLSNSPALTIALPNAFFASLGLASLAVAKAT